jgi:threonine/homoserine/homoserine lactone efflux protein
MPNGMANIINLIAFAISIVGLAGAIYLFYTTLKRVTKELKK